MRLIFNVVMSSCHSADDETVRGWLCICLFCVEAVYPSIYSFLGCCLTGNQTYPMKHIDGRRFYPARGRWSMSTYFERNPQNALSIKEILRT